MEYKCIALDMDGTLLNSKLEVSDENIEAMFEADKAGKTVVLCSGRAINEVEFVVDKCPAVTYFVGESGAIIYNFKEKKLLQQKLFPKEAAYKIIECFKTMDAFMLVCVNGIACIQTDQLPKLAHYHLDAYEYTYSNLLHHEDDLVAYALAHLDQIEKMNLYFAEEESRTSAYEMLKDYNVESVCVPPFIIENNAIGISKGDGLRNLCCLLNISLEECIMVGDSNNDLEALKVVGCPVAMGNAPQQIKDFCKHVVSTNDENGVKEAIETILLK